MKLKFNVYDHLTPEVKKIREDIFMKEQGFQSEFDDIDNTCKHVLAVDTDQNDLPAGCLRFFPSDHSKDTYTIGRVAVVKAFRGHGIGKQLLLFAEEYLKEKGVKHLELHAQQDKKGFYESVGYYQDTDEVFMDEFCPHIHMVKDL